MLVCVVVSSLARVLTRVEIWCVSYVSSLSAFEISVLKKFPWAVMCVWFV